MSAITTTARITVDIAEFQRAIRSVVVHAERQSVGAEQPITCRVRLELTADEFSVSATDGRSTARAWVHVHAQSHGLDGPWDGPLVVDLMPKQARQLAGAVTARTEDGELDGDAELTLDVDGEAVTITDVSGLYPHTSMLVSTIEQEPTDTLPGTDHLGYPDVRRILGEAFARGAGHVRPILPPPRILARFETAATQYGAPLVIEQVGDPDASAWIVTCGELFAGLFVDRPESDDQRRVRATTKIGFLRRLSRLDPTDAARLDLGAPVDNLIVDQPADTDEDAFLRPFRVVTD